MTLLPFPSLLSPSLALEDDYEEPDPCLWLSRPSVRSRAT